MRRQLAQQAGQRRDRALPVAVGALCRALPPCARPAPDALRRARFDRPQASLDFWRLLYALLKQIQGGKWTESDAIEGSWIRLWTESRLQREAEYRLVEVVLHQCNLPESWLLLY